MRPSKPTLTEAEVQALLAEQPEWSLHEGALVRSWSYKDFAEAMEFVNHVAALAEQANHHPDIDIRYNRVTLALISHDAGAITTRDAKMVRQLSEQFPSTPG